MFPSGARDLERKLRHFRDYYNHGRAHASLKFVTPIFSTERNVIALDDYQWRSHCRGLYQLPAAA
jgi:transposase InsO family protein